MALMEGAWLPAGMFTAGFQPEIVPSSVAKMKIPGFPAGLPLSRMKSVGLPLKTTPVGADCVPLAAKPAGGTMTKLSKMLPAGSGKMLIGCPLPL
jgi:hypothetical protein